MEVTGRCLCGACRLTATTTEQNSHACHCGMCQTWSGGVFMAVSCGESVRFNEGAPVRSYRASSWGERIFCAECGASLVWQVQGGTHQNVALACLAERDDFPLTSEIYIDHKPSGYAFAGDHRRQTAAEVEAGRTGQDD